MARPEAEARITKALSLNPHYPKAMNNLGVVYTKMGQLGMAVAAYKAATEISPKFAMAQFQLAEIYHRQLDFDRAEQAYRCGLHLGRDGNSTGVIGDCWEGAEVVVQ